jgi:hypothetical protein
MTSYAFHLETRRADGHSASIWAIAASVGTARALISAYRDAACLAGKDVTRDLGPIEFDAKQAAEAGLDLAGASSGLYCLLKQGSALRVNSGDRNLP